MSEGARVTSVSINNYGGTPTGSFGILHGDGGATTLPIDREDAIAIFAICMKRFEKKKLEIARKIEAIQPAPLLEYNEDKTIDQEEEVPY